ncbi:gamma-glutamyltransferase [Paenalcaligenes niemegkensis]|nr:gamma-glutamyltransferase [Paenalcaligenes niemegkensis]MCQ9617681.1 gamma-glutamyltransferase [Paenalcaligenes niemegkensis]
MSYNSQLTRPVIYAANGMVATGHPLASQAALAILQQGGSAMDAAITASAVLCVVDPAASGVGGDAFYTYYDHQTGKLEGLNASGKSAQRLDPGQFKNGIPTYGALSPTVPGIVHAWGRSWRDIAHLV